MFSIVYNPVLNQLWTGKKGHGAEHNGHKVRPKENTDAKISPLRYTSPPALSSERLC